MKDIVICPTITAENLHTYREQIERVISFAKRLHVDFADGEFAPTTLVSPNQAWLPREVLCDLHVMYQRPEHYIEALIALEPNAIILHAEAEGNIIGMLKEIRQSGISPGIALLQNTQPEDYANEIMECDQVLIFGGHLGYHGGQADLTQLVKVERVRAINHEAALAWDGGINDRNARQLVEAGVKILNVGGFIQKSDTPDSAYDIIKASIRG